MLLATGQTPYTLIHGDETRLRVPTVWWQPGPSRADAFNERGTWGLGTSDEPPQTFEPVTVDVWTFTSTSNTDADEVDWAVGTTDPLQFLAQRAWVGYQPYNDGGMSEHKQETSYQESISAWKRALVGDCVSSTFSPGDLQRLMPDPTGPLVQLTFQYSVGVDAPTGVLIKNAAEEQKIVRFLD